MPTPTEELHDHAVQVEKHAEQLATGLAKLGAAEEAVKFYTQVAEQSRRVATGLAKNMKDEPPEEEQPAGSMDEAADRMMARREPAPQ